MKRKGKIALITASVLTGVGFLLLVCALALAGFDLDLDVLTIDNMVTNTYEVEQTFDRISISNTDCDLRFQPSQDGTCSVTCHENENISHAVAVENGTLTVTRSDERKWFERWSFNISGSNTEIVVSLPQDEYDALSINSASGNIYLPGGFTFGDVDIQSMSGDISFLSDATGSVGITSISGEIYVSGINASAAGIRSTSGDIFLGDSSVTGALETGSTSGEIDLDSVVCGQFSARNVSGDVDLVHCDAHELQITSTSGDVSGSLLTGKVFNADTVSGNIELPPSDPAGGLCEVSTTSGDIEFIVAA